MLARVAENNAPYKMLRTTRTNLLIASVILLVLVIAGWYGAIPRPRYYEVDTLRAIHYDPHPGPNGWALRYEFAAPLDPSVYEDPARAIPGDPVAGLRPALIRSFTPADPTKAAFIAALVRGSEAGGVPFRPKILPGGQTVASNTVPRGVAQYTAPMTISGSGVMAFVIGAPE